MDEHKIIDKEKPLLGVVETVQKDISQDMDTKKVANTFGKVFIVTYIDFTRAVDTVNHDKKKN